MTPRQIRAIRDHVPRLFGLPPMGFIGPADWRERRRGQIERDAAAFAASEAAERERREYERVMESEELKCRLEQRGGMLFPGD